MSGNKIYTFDLELNWDLIKQLSELDTFGGSWSAIENRERQGLRELKSIATVRSVGASTRIEGSKITDDEVELLISHLDVAKLEERDQQEVAGYFEALDTIAEFYGDFDIRESHIKQIHQVLMKHSIKDAWHKGNYKQHSNVVLASHPDGSEQVVFQTTNPGIETEEAMRNLIAWHNTDTETHPIIRTALFVYDLLSIHPFQDGNGRLSRLLTTLLLLRQGYSWIQYVSFEHEIESRKKEYYQVLIECQRHRPGENINPWVNFFLDCLNNIQHQLMKKIEYKGNAGSMSIKEKKIYSYIESYPGSQSGTIAGKLGIPLPTLKKILAAMVTKNIILKHGIGKGTHYTTV
ncbi:MAG: Fic family protein [Bacteroidia bacterium]|jgi:Fic family protein